MHSPSSYQKLNKWYTYSVRVSLKANLLIDICGQIHMSSTQPTSCLLILVLETYTQNVYGLQIDPGALGAKWFWIYDRRDCDTQFSVKRQYVFGLAVSGARRIE